MDVEAMIQPTDEGFQLARAWPRTALVWGLAMVGLVVIFWPTLSAMVDIWWRSPTFNHGFLILPIVGYLVWERRVIFSLLRPRPCYLGLGIVAAGSLGWLLGAVADAQVVQQFGVVVIIQGSVVAIFGRSVARALVFPLFFLFFTVPFGEFLIPGLQNITAHIAVWMLKVSGLPVFSDGVFISVPNGDFHVAEACSGVRFLIASLPLGVLFANVSFLSWRRRSIVISLSVLIPIIANGLRAYGIIMIAYLTNNKYAMGVDHLVYGWIFFAFVTLVFLSIGMLFVDRPTEAPFVDTARLPVEQGAPAGFRPAVFAALFVLLAANMGPLYNRFLDRAAGSGDAVALKVPGVNGGWRLAETPAENAWHPLFKGNSSEILQNYIRADGSRVSLYIGYYRHQSRGADLLSFGNTVAAPAPWDWASESRTSVQLHGASIPASSVTIVGNYDRRRVWYWYWIDNRVTVSPLVAKLLIARTKLFSRRSNAAVIAVAIGDVALNEKKEAVLEDFLAHLEPLPPLLK